MSLKEKVKQNPELKRRLLNAMVHPVKTRPRGWLRLFRRFYTERGKGSVVCRSARLDIVPFNPFSLGARSVIEDFSTVNNAVGAVRIGDRSRIGLGNTIIGPVRIGDDVNLAQGITVSGLNHNFENICAPIAAQGVSTSEVVIADDVWIGANAVILAGVSIGSHSVVAAGAVVTKNVPECCVAAGNPARIVKYYDREAGLWKKIDRRAVDPFGMENEMEKGKPKVSVVIPVYNTEKYLEATLQSIRNQICCEIEIIVIDDGSTDCSAEIVRRAADETAGSFSFRNRTGDCPWRGMPGSHGPPASSFILWTATTCWRKTLWRHVIGNVRNSVSIS